MLHWTHERGFGGGGVTDYSEQKPQCGKLKTINPAGYKSVQYFGVIACTEAIYCIC